MCARAKRNAGKTKAAGGTTSGFNGALADEDDDLPL